MAANKIATNLLDCKLDLILNGIVSPPECELETNLNDVCANELLAYCKLFSLIEVLYSSMNVTVSCLTFYM